MKDSTSLYDQAKADVDAQITSDIEKYGFRHLAPDLWLRLINLEVKEAAQAINERRTFRDELIRLAAVCLTAVVSLDDQQNGEE